MRLNKISRIHHSAADGMVEPARKVSAMLDHPVRSLLEASRHFIYVAATPPLEEGNRGPKVGRRF